VFEELVGLPLHPLVVHAAVVFVPLLVLASLAYALVPTLRGRLGWVVVALAVVAPASTAVSVLSGNAFRERQALPLEGILADHRDLGTATMWVTIALGVLTLALVWARRSGGSTARTWLAGALTVLVVIAAGAALVLVVLTGDAGSRSHWEPLWPPA
jgi:uncharacterized membrane protein